MRNAIQVLTLATAWLGASPFAASKAKVASVGIKDRTLVHDMIAVPVGK